MSIDKWRQEFTSPKPQDFDNGDDKKCEESLNLGFVQKILIVIASHYIL